MKIATLQLVLSAWFKIAALKMTMGVLCIVALFFSAQPWGVCCPCVRFTEMRRDKLDKKKAVGRNPTAKAFIKGVVNAAKTI